MSSAGGATDRDGRPTWGGAVFSILSGIIILVALAEVTLRIAMPHWDEFYSGRFMQRVEIPEVTYSGAADLTGSVHVAAMPRHFVLTHRAASSADASTPLSIVIELSGAAVEQYPDTEWLDPERAVRVREDPVAKIEPEIDDSAEEAGFAHQPELGQARHE